MLTPQARKKRPFTAVKLKLSDLIASTDFKVNPEVRMLANLQNTGVLLLKNREAERYLTDDE